MESIKGMFGIIEDPRHESYVDHQLSDILILVMGAVVCGISELIDMMTYFENNATFYKEKFGIVGIPSKPTFSRVLSMINPDTVGAVMVEIMKQHTEVIGDILAIDGKAVCGTSDASNPTSCLQILSVYATESGVVLKQSAINSDDKTNEIPIVQEMLKTLNIEGKTITADAMHCQKETCEIIISGEGDYVLGVKGNQKNFYQDVKLFLDDPVNQKKMDSFETLEKNGGRIEKRVIRVTDDVDWLPNLDEWQGLNTLFSVTRTTTAGGKTTVETGYFITSRKPDAKSLLHISRSHWMIESMHWALDVVFHEDNNGFYSHNTQKVMNVLRKLALFAHKTHVANQPKKKRRSVKQNVFQALLNQQTCFEVLNFIP